MKTKTYWRVGKAVIKMGKLALENPKTRAKIVSTGKKIWQNPTVQSKAKALTKRFSDQSADKPDKNQTKMF